MVPLPSWPDPLYPQHRTPPEVRVAQVCAKPLEMAVAVEIPDTMTGTLESVAEDPLPSAPQALLPQQRTDWSVRAAQVWPPPAETAAAPVRPVTVAGTSVSVVVPLPNCPRLFHPQQRASPLLRATQVWSWPAAMLVAPVMLETATGVVESVVVPLPS